MSSGNDQIGSVDPNLRLTDPRGGIRYPSPFFDISQQYVPPTIKELFKWVYFYATNNSFLGPALNKIARYPITDLIFEDGNEQLIDYWKNLLNNTLQMKTFQMETNMDLITYGNAFVSLHYPFSRLLECANCKTRVPWKAAEKKVENLKITLKCKACRYTAEAKIRDIPYKSIENVRLIRTNPEFIDIKYNDATGRHTYLYSIPDKLRRQIISGDPDILEDTPEIYFQAIKNRKKIKLNNQNLFHLKRPTLAGKDMGWGVPLMAVALKDLYYFYTLRRGQEAIINEHIIPSDVIFPEANGKFDPYVHSDLSNWRNEIQNQLAKKRRDPNYKLVLPFPIGHERIGGDGKALMLTPEMDFLAKTIIGAMGIPQEFVYGGTMNWTGSSISLRTLENEFLHHRSQLIQMTIWLVERLRIYLGSAAPKAVKFSDFKMADDMQKLQLMIGMASNNRLSWEDILKEMGKDPHVENKKIERETEFQARLQERQTLIAAEAQAKAMALTNRMQNEENSQSIKPSIQPDPNMFVEIDEKTEMPTLEAWAKRLINQSPGTINETLSRVAALEPSFAKKLKLVLEQMGAANEVATEKEQNQMQMNDQVQHQANMEKAKAQAQPKQPKPQPQKPQQPNLTINMKPMPEQKPPRRKGGV